MTNLPEQELERIRARRRGKKQGAPDDGVASAPAAPERQREGFLRTLRGWADALIFAFLLAMFIRTYVFELFMIPTGSMTPTLIGDEARMVSEYDWDGDGQDDIIVQPNRFVDTLQVHLRNEEGEFDETLFVTGVPQSVSAQFARHPEGKGRRDMIMVNKFAYWFSEPDRGDVIVFKVPDVPEKGFPFQPAKPVFIKRAIGLPGEQVTLRPIEPYKQHAMYEPERISPDTMGGIEYVLQTQPVLIDGEPLAEPPFDRLHHFPSSALGSTFNMPAFTPLKQQFNLTENEVLMLGDNQTSSQDSRYWGPVPLSHLRGKAILRYFPFRTFGFLDQ